MYPAVKYLFCFLPLPILDKKLVTEHNSVPPFLGLVYVL